MVRDSAREATITIPHPIAAIADEMAKELNWSFEKALLALLTRGVEAQRKAHQQLEARYEIFMNAPDGEAQDKAWDALFNSIAGSDFIA